MAEDVALVPTWEKFLDKQDKFGSGHAGCPLAEA